MIYYIADTHFGHERIIQLNNRPFANIDEMKEVLINNWNRKAGKDDLVYIVGDFSMRSREHPVGILKRLNGHKILIEGNHDYKMLKDPKFRECFEEICQIKNTADNGRQVTLCHYPIIEWPNYFRNSYLVYAHIHNNTKNNAYRCMREEPRALNAGVDINNFEPVTLDEMIVNNKIFNETHPWMPNS